MPIKKKKISELTLADSLTGLYTIGCKIIDGIQTSVKVSLGTIQTAYENMLTEISNARAATKAANTAASNANTAKPRRPRQRLIRPRRTPSLRQGTPIPQPVRLIPRLI